MLSVIDDLIKLGIENKAGNREVVTDFTENTITTKEVFETFEVIIRSDVTDRYGDNKVKGISAIFRSFYPKNHKNYKTNKDIVLFSIFEIEDKNGEIKQS